MKGIAWAALAFFATSVAVSAEPPKQAMFLELLKERLSGYAGDKQAWKRHVAEDCIWVGNGMAVMDRKSVEGMQVDTGAKVEIEDLAVHDYGEVAVLTYITVEHFQQGDAIRTQRYRKADTYARLQGDWKLIANAEIRGRPDRKVAHVDPAVLDRYAGTYVTMFNGKPVKTRFWRDGARFFAQTEGQEAGEMLPESETLFFDAATAQEGSADNIFVLDADGQAVEWIYRDGGIEYRASKVK